MVKLSVIVPVYNVEKYLRRCIDSILGQTFQDFELILVDDGSPDNCPQICDEYAKTDSRIRVIHKTNGGLSDARNAGLDIAKGEYIGFVDSDDYIHPQMYERLLVCAEKYEADSVVGQIKFVPDIIEDRTTFDSYVGEPAAELLTKREYIGNYYPDNHSKIPTVVCNKVYKGTIFSDLRFPKGKINEDAAIKLSILDSCDCIALLDEEVYYYVQRDGSIMNAPFSVKRFHAIEPPFNNITFFEKRGIDRQQRLAEQDYAICFLRCFFAVTLKYCELKDDFADYFTLWKLKISRLLKNPEICRMQKLMILLSLVSPKLSYRIAKEYFPECLFEFMR